MYAQSYRERQLQPTVNALFYEALSGEFRPPSDPQNRTHKLGLLGLAAYTKGRECDGIRTLSAYLAEGRRSFRYSPSWAKNTTTTVLCSQDRTNAVHLGGLLLEAPDGTIGKNSVLVYRDYMNESGFGLAIDGSIPVFYPLRLDKTLDEARLMITEIAQRFFNRLAAAP